MFQPNKELYEFDEFRLDETERILWRKGERVPLAEKTFEMLCALVKRGNHLVGKDELMTEIWADAIVEENSLDKNISYLRKILGETADKAKFIETVRGHGYRFLPEVRRVKTGEESSKFKVQSSKFGVLISEPEIQNPKSEIQNPNRPGNVVALADWRHETNAEHQTDGNQLTSAATIEQFAPKVEASGKQTKRFKKGYLFAVGALVVFGIAAFGWSRWLNLFGTSSSASFQTMKMERLTDTGKVVLAVISPDGNFAVYVSETNGQQSLRLYQIATRRDVEIRPFNDSTYQAVAFSHDGNFIYFVATRKNQPDNPLYQIPVIGGDERKLIDDIGTLLGDIALSPDGRQIAFAVNPNPQGESALMIINTDGTNAQKLMTRKIPQRFVVLGWSPDGQTIVCAVTFVNEGHRTELLAVNIADGAERQIGQQNWWTIWQTAAWMPDGSGFVMTAKDKPFNSKQVWYVSYPDGVSRRITNDLSNYQGASLTANGKTLLTVGFDQPQQLYVAPNGDAALARQITRGTGLSTGFDWTPDGKIVYLSREGRRQDLWIMDADGEHPKQLTHSGDNEGFGRPSVSPDGRYIVFPSRRGGTLNVWRMDIDGGHLTQLTDKTGDLPVCAPEGKWVIYYTLANGVGTLWRVPLEGGEPEQLSKPDVTIIAPMISPDGKLIACRYINTAQQSKGALEQMDIAVLPFEGGEPVRIFAPPGGILFGHGSYPGGVFWMPDSRALMYFQERDGIGNVWTQPLDGGAARQITSFTTDKILAAKWSRDGNQLALVRGSETSDVIQITFGDGR